MSSQWKNDPQCSTALDMEKRAPFVGEEFLQGEADEKIDGNS